MFNFSTTVVTLFAVIYLVSGFFLLLQQEKTETECGQKITVWDRIPCFIPLVNTVFAVWAFFSDSDNDNKYN